MSKLSVQDMGKYLGGGKTKELYETKDDVTAVYVFSKDDITAGDGAKRDVIPGKGCFSTETTCNVFELLRTCGIPVAFRERVGDAVFLADRCTMLPLEVVVRREAHGSFLKRHPHIHKGHYFPKLVYELYLKTIARTFKGDTFPVDDPLIIFHKDGRRDLFDPKKSFYPKEPFRTIFTLPFHINPQCMEVMERIARETFLILEGAWRRGGGKLVDLKVEFGFNARGELVLADVIDNDSWRVVEHGRYVDKQVYREGGSLEEVTRLYERVARHTAQFKLPHQQIVLWLCSAKDSDEPFKKALDAYRGIFRVDCLMNTVVSSMHKETEKGLALLRSHVQRVPDAVCIVYVGLSNGAGPIIAAHTSIPVIAVPRDSPTSLVDIWSSLNLPSGVPLLTVLNPENAVLAAIQILAQNNPRLYASIQAEKETRLPESI